MSPVHAALVQPLQAAVPIVAAGGLEVATVRELAVRAAAEGNAKVYYGSCPACGGAEPLPWFDLQRSAFPACEACGNPLRVFVCTPPAAASARGEERSDREAKRERSS